jgi:nucleotidyltransferase/DNA polymerase involved in DNA repair
MHIDFNSFFPSCEELSDPSLKEKPHAVIMTDEIKDRYPEALLHRVHMKQGNIE